MTAPEAWAEPGLDAALDVVVVLAHVIEQVRTADDLVPALAEAASLAARGLGFGTVTINLARPLHDDFPVVVCEGSTANREVVAGHVGCEAAHRRGAPAALRAHRAATSSSPASWTGTRSSTRRCTRPTSRRARTRVSGTPTTHSSLPLRARDGELLGLMWLDEPLDGLRPSDAQLRLASIIGRHAAHAVEEATAVIRAQEHRLAMSHLLATSLILHGTDAGEVLQALCAAVHDALGFDRVAVTLRERSGSSAPRAAVGWSPEELAAWPDLDALERRLAAGAGAKRVPPAVSGDAGDRAAGMERPHAPRTPAPDERRAERHALRRRAIGRPAARRGPPARVAALRRPGRDRRGAGEPARRAAPARAA